MPHKTLTNKQAFAMLDLQCAMNCKVNPDWINAGYPFLRAIVIEGAEAIEHHGWKWWKAQTMDLAQLQMEMIDIWHFALSDVIIQSKGDLVFAAASLALRSESHRQDVIFDGTIYDFAEMDLPRKLEIIIGLAAARRFSIPLFSSAMIDCGLTWESLYRQYIAKNILNMFRQDHGYKTGEYRKVWEGREDNEHLVELMNEGRADEDGYAEKLYQGLNRRYLETRQAA